MLSWVAKVLNKKSCQVLTPDRTVLKLRERLSDKYDSFIYSSLLGHDLDIVNSLGHIAGLHFVFALHQSSAIACFALHHHYLFSHGIYHINIDRGYKRSVELKREHIFGRIWINTYILYRLVERWNTQRIYHNEDRGAVRTAE